MAQKYKQESKKQEAGNEPRSVRSCTHPQRTRRQENAKKVLSERAKRTDQEQLQKLDKLLGKNKGAKKERSRLKAKIAQGKKHESNKQKGSKKIRT